MSVTRRLSWIIVACAIGGLPDGALPDQPDAAPEPPPPGTVLSARHWQAGEGFVSEEILSRVAAGDFELCVKRGPTDVPPPRAYRDATEQYAPQIELTPDGALENYVAGRPFPTLEPDDPYAGLKAAWNLRYRYAGGSIRMGGRFLTGPLEGSPERVVEFEYAREYGVHGLGPTDGPAWDEEGIFYKEFYRVVKPFDMRGMMRLTYRYDAPGRPDDNWIYNPAMKRVRKTVLPLDESIMGSDLVRGDYFGFNGRVLEHQWKLVAERRLLVPFGIPAAEARFGGKENVYPGDCWEVRRTLLVEAVPAEPDHPYGKRVVAVDRQTYAPLYVLVYDGEGRHSKTIFLAYADPRHVPGNEGVQAPIWLGHSIVDYQRGHRTRAVFHGVTYGEPISNDLFDVTRLVEESR